MLKKALQWLAFMMIGILPVIANGPAISLPSVAGGSIPLYPPLARAAGLQGIVHIEISTDGHRVIKTQILDGNKLLAQAAEENARTWSFSSHDSTTFVVTYRYKLDADSNKDPYNPTILLRLPTEVEISIAPMPSLTNQ